MQLPPEYIEAAHRKAILLALQEHLRSLRPEETKPSKIESGDLPALIRFVPIGPIDTVLREMETEIEELEARIGAYVLVPEPKPPAQETP